MTMTAKEKRYVRKLEIRIEELERHFKIANDAHTEIFSALYHTRTAMRIAYETILEAADSLQENIKNDPAYMAKSGGTNET